MSQQTRYTKSDLMLGKLSAFDREGEIVVHTHTVEFVRPLTEAERYLFRDVLRGFYHTVRFSRQFGTDLIAEPLVEFVTQTQARYTLRQTGLQGDWKELLLAILTNFSREIAPIARHDDSQPFAVAGMVEPA